MKRIPKKFTGIIFGLMMAVMMSGVMSGFMILLNVGYTDRFFVIWGRAFMMGFLVAVPTALIARFIAQRIVSAIVEK